MAMLLLLLMPATLYAANRLTLALTQTQTPTLTQTLTQTLTHTQTLALTLSLTLTLTPNGDQAALLLLLRSTGLRATHLAAEWHLPDEIAPVYPAGAPALTVEGAAPPLTRTQPSP